MRRHTPVDNDYRLCYSGVANDKPNHTQDYSMARNSIFTVGSAIARSLARSARGVDVHYGTTPDLKREPDSRTSRTDDEERVRLGNATRAAQAIYATMGDYTRAARYRDYAVMMRDTPEIRRAVKVLTDHSFVGSTRTNHLNPYAIAPNTTAISPTKQALVDDLWRRLDMANTMVTLTMHAVVYGDGFSQVVYAKTRNQPGKYHIVNLARLPSEVVSGTPNGYGSASHWKIRAPNESFESGVVYTPFEILHVAYMRDWDKLYGTSLLETLRKTFRREEAAEDMLLGLLTLAGSSRKSVAYPVPALTSVDEMDKWRSKLAGKAYLKKLFDRDGLARRELAIHSTLTDDFYPYSSGSEPPTFHNEPPANLAGMKDVAVHQQDRYAVGMGVPATLLNINRDSGAKTAIELQGVNFAKTILGLQQVLSDVWWEVYFRLCVAAGETPVRGECPLILPPVERFDNEVQARADKTRVGTAMLLGQSGVDVDEALRVATPYDVKTVNPPLWTLGGEASPDVNEPSAAGTGDGEGSVNPRHNQTVRKVSE